MLLLVKRTFETKSNATFKHKFSKEEREFYSEYSCGFKRFWKETGLEVGGTLRIDKEIK